MAFCLDVVDGGADFQRNVGPCCCMYNMFYCPLSRDVIGKHEYLGDAVAAVA